MSQEKYVQESFAIIIKGLLYDFFPLNFVVFWEKNLPKNWNIFKFHFYFRFQKTDILPDLVKSRLGKVPIVLEHLLQDSPTTSVMTPRWG